ncbi:programmed cell death [Cyclospora cayetanensis]|uniref:Programmed cell death n=1 Tax=Cyclospora cayetanensis TaxID=88456 RepID=A0A1D3CWE4_9EIME|nr:programmed cell death [Cyclospora cayetanensis]
MAGRPSSRQFVLYRLFASSPSHAARSDTSATAAIMAPSRGTSGDTHGQAQTIDEATKAAVIRLLQRGERLRQVCCCPVCGLSGGDVVSETEHAAAVELLQQQLLRNERRLQVLLRQQQEEAAEAAESDEETDPSGVVDLDSTEFEFEDTEADQRGLLLLDGVHIKAGRVLHPRCLKRLKFGSVFVAFPEFPLSAETEELGNKESSANETLEAALERLGLAGDNEPLSHEEELLKQYQQTIKETPEADLDESETDAFEEIYQQHTSQDPQLEVFLKRCGRPHQKGHVVRYAQGGTPLWPFSKGQIKPAEVQPHLISQLAERVGLHDPAGVASVERLSFGLVAALGEESAQATTAHAWTGNLGLRADAFGNGHPHILLSSSPTLFSFTEQAHAFGGRTPGSDQGHCLAESTTACETPTGVSRARGDNGEGDASSTAFAQGGAHSLSAFLQHHKSPPSKLAALEWTEAQQHQAQLVSANVPRRALEAAVREAFYAYPVYEGRSFRLHLQRRGQKKLLAALSKHGAFDLPVHEASQPEWSFMQALSRNYLQNDQAVNDNPTRAVVDKSSDPPLTHSILQSMLDMKCTNTTTTGGRGAARVIYGEVYCFSTSSLQMTEMGTCVDVCLQEFECPGKPDITAMREKLQLTREELLNKYCSKSGCNFRACSQRRPPAATGLLTASQTRTWTQKIVSSEHQ